MGILKDAILAAIQQEHPDAHWVGNEKPHMIESTAQAKYNDVRRVERNYTKGVHKAKERRLTMDECITKEMTKSLLKAFEGMNESLEDFQKACASTIESTEKHIVSALFLRESAMLIKLAESSFVTRWYYKHKYREAKYHRIKAERFFNQNFK